MTDTQDAQIIFDLMGQSYQPPWPVIVIGGLVSLFALIDWLRPRRRRAGSALKFLSLLVPIGVGVLVGLHWLEYRSLRDGVEEGNTHTVEGVVEEFRPGPSTRNLPETFVIRGERFVVHAATISAAYHQTSSTGGPDLEGRCVEIGYLLDRNFSPARKRIVFLALRNSGCEPSQPSGEIEEP